MFGKNPVLSYIVVVTIFGGHKLKQIFLAIISVSLSSIAANANDCAAREIATETTWTGDEKITFAGPALSCLYKDNLAGTALKCSASDGYSVEIPVDMITKYEPILANTIDGDDLKNHNEGPAWVIWPRSEHDLGQTMDDYFIWSVVECTGS